MRILSDLPSCINFAKKFKRVGKIVSMHYEKTPETKGQFLQLTNGIFNAE